MNRAVASLVVALMAVLSSPVAAQTLVVTVRFASPTIGDSRVGEEEGGAYGRAIFRLGEAPRRAGQNSIAFDAQYAEFVGEFGPGLASDSPFVPEVGEEPRVATFARLEYVGATDQLRLVIGDALSDLRMIIPTPAGAFSMDMTSLPGTSGAYNSTLTTNGMMVAEFAALDPLPRVIRATWRRDGGFLGAIDYRVRILPAMPARSRIDIAEPYGVLDFRDVLAFLSAFVSQ